MDFYTSSVKYGNKILYRGVKNGKRVKLRIDYCPTLYVPSATPSRWKTLDGVPLDPVKFYSINEAREYVEKYKGIHNYKIYGNDAYAYAFLADEFPGVIDWDIEKIAVDYLDIETSSKNGFPNPYVAEEPITAITIIRNGKRSTTFGCKDYITKDSETYIKCIDEIDLCQRFLNFWENNYPDILTGWNSRYFDIPYLYNRSIILLGEEKAKKLSPWGQVKIKHTFQKNTGKVLVSYDLVGIGHLDYIELYKKFAKGGSSQENYKLDTIAYVELKRKKISFEEYDNLQKLYENDYQKFIEYNIEDVKLIVALEDKLKLIELALTLAYDSKSNYEDVFTQTRMWDALIYNYLLERDIIVPPKEMDDKDEAFEGAYVKDPQIGLHKNIASFDLNSLYPHLMMQYNISPETLIQPEKYTDVMRQILMSGVSVEAFLNKEINLSLMDGYTITPNGQFFRTDKQGFLPEMLQTMYLDRKKFKDMKLKAQQEYENENDEEKKKEINKLVARYNNLQLAKKVGLNSAYGIMGSQYFRFFDIRLALAVTSTGQLSIKWIEDKINQYMNRILGTDVVDYVIASDTDSIYLRLDELVRKVLPLETDVNKIIEFMNRVCEDKIQPYIDLSYQELADYVHAYAQKMKMKREVLADKGIWTAKKRYILNVYNSEGVQYKEPKLKIMGLETAKSSTPTVVKEKMKELIKIIMTKTEKDVQDHVAKFKAEFKTLSPEDVSFPRGVNGLNEYSDPVTVFRKGTPIHVKGSLYYNLFLVSKKLNNKYPKIQEGEKIKFTYLKQPNPIKSPVISYPNRLPPEFGLNEYIDYNTQFEKTFIKPMSVILDCIGWRAEKVNSLQSFFM